MICGICCGCEGWQG